MSQTDGVVANGDGASVRADINDHLGALFSLSSGPTAPATIVANMWWFDTANGQLKRRNNANTAWNIYFSDDGSTVQPYSGGSALVYSNIPRLDAANVFTARQRWAKGADVASASTLTLGADGNFFDVTGTTTITAIATAGGGTTVKLQFDGALTLTHHATDLILPGGANITTAAGDIAEFVEYATGDWVCTNYQRAADAPGNASLGWNAFTPVTVGSSVNSIEFTGIDTAADEICLHWSELRMATEGSGIGIEIGNSGGFITSGYTGRGTETLTPSTTTGQNFADDNATTTLWCGSATLRRIGAVWSMSAQQNASGGRFAALNYEVAVPSPEVDRVRLICRSGTDNFTAGTARGGYR